MAKVDFLQPTDMSAIPTTSGGGTGVSQSLTEIDVSTSNGFDFFILGSFQPSGGGFDRAGTITRVMIETTDFGDFPDLDITGLSFFSDDINTRVSNNPAQFVADLLSGDDTINGSSVADTMLGFAGNDILNGGLGADIMKGGIGNDFYFVDNAGDTITELAGEGTLDRVFTSVSYNLTAGAAIENMSTANQAGTEAINLRGNGFNNFVVGNDGQNIVAGGAGNDNLVGLGGNDFFLFEDTPNNSNADYAADFAVGQDHIMLVRAGGYGSLAAGSLADANFLVRGTAFQDANDLIIWDAANGVLSYDADGSGAGAAQAIALLTANLNLHASDIIVV